MQANDKRGLNKVHNNSTSTVCGLVYRSVMHIKAHALTSEFLRYLRVVLPRIQAHTLELLVYRYLA